MVEQLDDPDILRNIPIFDSLSDDELIAILKSSDNKIENYEMKETVIREDEIGDAMYVILDGNVEVSIRSGTGGKDINIATLRPGDFFGEQALMPGGTGRRNASVRALHPIKLFRIDKKHVLLSIEGGVDESEDITAIRPPSEKNSEIRELIEGMRLFQSLKESELASIDMWTEVSTVGPGDLVLKESEKGDCLYVVLEGTVEIFTFDDDDKIVMLAQHKRGNYFGEQALMPGSTGVRSAYARSDDEVRLIKVPKAYFRLVLNRDSDLAAALGRVGEAQKEELQTIQKS